MGIGGDLGEPSKLALTISWGLAGPGSIPAAMPCPRAATKHRHALGDAPSAFGETGEGDKGRGGLGLLCAPFAEKLAKSASTDLASARPEAGQSFRIDGLDH